MSKGLEAKFTRSWLVFAVKRYETRYDRERLDGKDMCVDILS